MDNNFIMDSTSWDYANLAKSAARHGGPKEYVDAIYNAGLAADIANAKLLGIKVGITVGMIGIAVGVAVGIFAYSERLKWLSSKRKSKNEELIIQIKSEIDENIDQNVNSDLQNFGT